MFNIQCEQASSARWQAHNHLDHHQEGEESICKHDHQSKLHAIRTQNMSLIDIPLFQSNNRVGEKLTIRMPHVWNKPHWWWAIRIILREGHDSVKESSFTATSPTLFNKKKHKSIETKGQSNLLSLSLSLCSDVINWKQYHFKQNLN